VVGRLRVISGPGRGKELSVEDQFVVGRAEEGLGKLEGDPEISRRHARFYLGHEGSLVVEDLGSTNGTFVNDRRIEGPHLVRPGDQVRIGMTVIELPQAGLADASTEVRTRVRGPSAPAEAAGAGRVASAAAPPTASGPSPQRTPVFNKPRLPPPAPPRRSRGGWAALLALVLIAGAAVAGYFVGHGNATANKTITVQQPGGGGPTTPANPAAAAGVVGTVYIESNIAQPNGNSILAFQYRTRGDLHPMQVTEYPTGGAGSADLTDSGVLDADQHLWLDNQKHLLFAVNQGSDTVAVFHVLSDGSLRAVIGSPFPSGGWAPVSLGVSGDTLIVANKAQDGVRKLSAFPPTYATFHIGSDGTLTHFGPVRRAPPGNSPTDAMVAPNGTFVMSTEEGGPFRAFLLGSGGLTLGANSPLQPDASIFPRGLDPSKRWGLGISASPIRDLVYIGMATVSKIAVYRFDATGRLTFIRAVNAPGAALPCWTLVNKGGTRLYTANAGNNTMSVFDLTDPTDPKPLQTLRLHGDGNPWDIRFDPTQQMIFLIDPRARMNVPPGSGQGLHTLLINGDGTLFEPSYSPVTVPVGLNVNPFGMAVLARSTR
jgi:DNA-binding beta-propeller fold protein YncE